MLQGLFLMVSAFGSYNFWVRLSIQLFGNSILERFSKSIYSRCFYLFFKGVREYFVFEL